MTEKSYLWDGTVTGDSTLAPYYAETFNAYMHLHLNHDSMYVLSGYLNSLELIRSEYSLTVKPGAALSQNVLYIQNEKVSFSLSSVDSGSFRVDTVVLQVDYSAQTARLVIKEGVIKTSLVTATQNLATLIQTSGFLWEEALFYVLIDGDGVFNYEGDQRHFIINFNTQLKITPLINTEYLAFTLGTGTLGPEGWYDDDLTLLSDTTVPSTQGRGRGIVLNQDQGIGQIVPVSKGINKTFTFTCLHPSITSVVVKMRGYLPSGDVTDWYTSLGVTYFENFVKLTHTFSEEIVAVEVLLLNPFANNTTIGQAILTEEYHTGNNQFIIDRLIDFQEVIRDAAWTDTAKSTGSTTIFLTASFNNDIKLGTKAVVLRLEGRDSGSAAGAGVYLRGASLKTEGDMLLDAVPNDYKRSLTIFAPVSYEIFNTSSNTPQFVLSVQATGAGTLDATAELAGLIT